MNLRDYQIRLSNEALQILHGLRIVYFVMEVRCGKTLTSLHTADIYGAKKVLFITKIKAFSSIQSDYEALKPNFDIQIINKESLHKITDNDFDLLIVDENHAVSSTFPKPNKSAKEIKARFGNLPQIYLSGTPAIESGSQWYHSFWISNFSPFQEYRNFYAWAKDFVEVKEKHFGQIKVKDYSHADRKKINEIINPYLLKFTQKDAGFNSEITEMIVEYQTPKSIKKMVNRLLLDNVLIGKEETILGDSPAKLMSKIHQLENGTIIFESGKNAVIDTSKAEFIREYFKGKKIAIFYYFKNEMAALKVAFCEDLTFDLDEFNTTDKHIAIQQVSGSEGISLAKAEALVFMNFGYSGRLYVQGRDRLTTIDREENNIFFVMDKTSINYKIYQALREKKTYNEKTFIKDYHVREQNTSKHSQLA